MTSDRRARVNSQLKRQFEKSTGPDGFSASAAASAANAATAAAAAADAAAAAAAPAAGAGADVGGAAPAAARGPFGAPMEAPQSAQASAAATGEPTGCVFIPEASLIPRDCWRWDCTCSHLLCLCSALHLLAGHLQRSVRPRRLQPEPGRQPKTLRGLLLPPPRLTRTRMLPPQRRRPAMIQPASAAMGFRAASPGRTFSALRAEALLNEGAAGVDNTDAASCVVVDQFRRAAPTVLLCKWWCAAAHCCRPLITASLLLLLLPLLPSADDE